MPSGIYIRTKEHLINYSKSRMGHIVSQETREKIGKANRGHKMSIEAREKMRTLALKNPKRYWLGKKRYPETVEKVRLALTGRKNGPCSEETKRKISEANKGNRYWVSKAEFSSIEIKLQNLLKENDVEFEVNYPLFGTPDIFIKPNICIFADGCYWHKCSECGFEESIRKERERDKEVTQKLQSQGYVVIRLWEHCLKDKYFYKNLLKPKES